MELTEANVRGAIEQHMLLMERAKEIAALMFEIRTNKKWAPSFEIEIDDEDATVYARYYYGHNDSDSMTIPLSYLWTDNGDINLLEQAAIEKRNRLAEEKKAAEKAKAEAEREARDRATYERLRAVYKNNPEIFDGIQ